jgi:hypothetical protein
MANRHGGHTPSKRPAAGLDDIERGNLGTADQGPGDVSPNEKVDQHTGEVAGYPMGKSRGGAKKP